MSTDDKIKRALYLKGIIVGKSATIELTQPISGRNAADEYVHFAEKGDQVRATMTDKGWHVIIKHLDTQEILVDGVIPLANGKFRSA
jgi:hypothetical protein